MEDHKEEEETIETKQSKRNGHVYFKLLLIVPSVVASHQCDEDTYHHVKHGQKSVSSKEVGQHLEQRLSGQWLATSEPFAFRILN